MLKLLFILLFPSILFAQKDTLVPYSVNDTLWGYNDTLGNQVINPQFSYASRFVNGYAMVTKGKTANRYNPGIIDTKGEFVIAPQEGEFTILKTIPASFMHRSFVDG